MRTRGGPPAARASIARRACLALRRYQTAREWSTIGYGKRRAIASATASIVVILVLNTLRRKRRRALAAQACATPSPRSHCACQWMRAGRE
eukprot:scaffold2140_cov394-Prasinococcus_capsulatus_cf.AAC.3